MSARHDDERLADIVDAITAIKSHLTRGELSDGLIFDAVRVRLIEIGEAVKLLDPKLVASEPDVRWPDAAVCATGLLTITSTPPGQWSKQLSPRIFRHLKQLSCAFRCDLNSLNRAPQRPKPTIRTTIAGLSR